MSKTDEQWWEAQCGEYVLGTLRGPERDVFEKILLVDDDARSRVVYWEQKLSALENQMHTRQVPAPVLPLLMKRIRAHEQQKRKTNVAHAHPATSHSTLAHDLTGTWTEDIESVLAGEEEISDTAEEISDTAEESSHTLEQSIEQYPQELFVQSDKTPRFWKPLALAATAATIVLSALMLGQTTQEVDHRSIPESGSLSLVQDTNRQTLWLMTLPDTAEQITIFALAPPALLPDQSHQLWLIKPDSAGVSSVGLLPRQYGESSTMQLSEQILPGAVFAVSLEPAAGSPEPLPTGPILFNADIQQLKKQYQ